MQTHFVARLKLFYFVILTFPNIILKYMFTFIFFWSQLLVCCTMVTRFLEAGECYVNPVGPLCTNLLSNSMLMTHTCTLLATLKWQICQSRFNLFTLYNV